MVTRRERLRRAYHHEEMDRPAVYSRTGFPADDPTYDRLKAYLHLHTELKQGWNSARLESGPHTEWRDEPHSEDFTRRIFTLFTPAGKLERSYLESRKGLPGMHESYFISSPQDAETYLSLPLPEFHGDVAPFQAAQGAVGDRGIVDTYLGFNAAGYVAELCGSETFAVLSVTHRELLHALCARQMQVLRRRVEFLLELGVGPYFSILGQEYVVPPLHGRPDFDDFNVRYDTPILDLIHEASGRVHVHSHGAIGTVFDGFLAMGADVLHPCEPPPMGDITAAEVKQRSGGAVCLEGNLQIDRLYESTPEEIRAEVTQLITDAFADGRGLIVSASASPYVRGAGHDCFPQYEAMIQTVLEWGRKRRSRSTVDGHTMDSKTLSTRDGGTPGTTRGTMDGRTRIRALIAGERADRSGFWLGNPHGDSWPAIHRYLGTSTQEQARRLLGDDLRWIPAGVYRHPAGRGMFDIPNKTAHGSPGPFAACEDAGQVDQLYEWPNPDYLDFEPVLAQLRECGPFYRASGFWAPFYHHVMDLFGMEQYMMNMHLNPDLVHAVTDRVCAFYYEANERFFAAAGDLMDGYFFGNDFGTQVDLICGPVQFDAFVMPWFRRFTEQAHAHGYQVILHSCGSVHKVIQRLIDAGVECLHPLQALAANMDADTLARDFGGRITFLGGIDTQELLVHGTPDQVWADVLRVRDTLGPNVIISPSHEALLPNVSPANIEAMAAAAVA